MIRTLKKEDWFHADGFPIAVERRNPQQPFGLHAHEFSELVLVTGGRGLHVTGEDSWQLGVGDVFVIGGSRPHDYLNMENLQLINVLFDQQELAFELQDLPSLPGYHALFHLEPAWRQRHDFKSRLRLSPADLRIAMGLIDELDEELEIRHTGFGFVTTAVFMQLVGFLSRCYDRAKNVDSCALLRIAQTITFVESNYTETVHLDKLVDMSQMSKRSFLRAFEAAIGCTPIAYVIQLRLARAAKLLRQTNDSITDIALSVGFNDSNYFARQFRKHFTVSPRAFRKHIGLQ
ncbi:MAG: helix-turn-helix domain-containing protein [Bythopirellula sp.]